jgi:translation initiation factor IF-2
MGMGQLATINQFLDAETAQALAMEFGVELTAQKAKSAEDDLIEQFDSREKGEMRGRAPVVTFLGHVDHGKTSLLDRIRNEKVASGEAGGITQHTGAYRYDEGDVHVTFLDTPGHEAFTAMRSRGANMTDVVVLVVAADDGVMPQTAEAINHAKAAEVPIVVALNKVDLPNANIQRALAQLAEHELTPQQWGGDTEIIETSAQTGQGVDTLLETLSLEAELLDLKADPEGPATGYVIEAEMKPGLGVVARLLILDGTLHQGEILLAGQGYGRVRAMTDATGQAITEAGPSTPVEVSGLDEVPVAGDRFYIVEALDTARSVAEDRRERSRIQQLATAPHKSLESLLNQIEAGESNQLPVIIKADVQGSVEALVESLKKLGTEEVQLNILHAGVGAVSTGDVTLAEASSAIILGFNVVSDATARKLAEQNGIDIRLYRVIYDLIEDMRKALEEGLAPEISQKTLGRAEVRQVFKISRVGTIAGCIVADGVVNRNAKVRITRGGIVVADERRLDSLKRFKDDVREVRNGMECGLKVAGFDDLKEGDILEFYEVVQVARTL